MDRPAGDDVAALDDASTLGEARDWLRERVEHGERCPCCTQFAKVYRRALPSATARAMIALHRHSAPGEFVFLPPLLDAMHGTPALGGYATLGHFWGLLEQQPGEREDGSWRVGWWRLTPNGRAYVIGALPAVPKYARIYDGRCLGLDGPPWSITDALGSKFDYRELMGW
jgi:hypothetical protein